MDAVSDTFVDILKGLPKLKNPDSFGPWAFRILSLKCKNMIGREIEKRNTIDIDDMVKTPSLSASPIDETISESSSLYAALKSLKDEDRMIIVLSVLHGYSNKEISKIMDMPQGTVSSKLARSYTKLRKMLGGE